MERVWKGYGFIPPTYLPHTILVTAPYLVLNRYVPGTYQVWNRYEINFPYLINIRGFFGLPDVPGMVDCYG